MLFCAGRCKHVLAVMLAFLFLMSTGPRVLIADPNAESSFETPYSAMTTAQLQQVAARIALYPDPLVAQILAASTFPDQIVTADRWLKDHPTLKGKELASAVDAQPWDPSVKSL